MQTSTTWKPWLFALLAGLLGLAGERMVEHFQRERMVNHEREHIVNQLAGLRASLEGVVNGNLLMVHGLSAVIAAQPDIEQEEFARIASGMIGDAHAMRNIAGAPDLVVRLMHPAAGNEAAIGLDYRTHPTQRDAALRAAESGEIVIAGPLELVQGGLGLVAREPVLLLPDHAGEPRRLWGLVSAVIDVDKLYQLAGIAELEQKSGLELAIRGRDGRGATGDVFYGDATLFDNAPVLAPVSLPSGSWQLAAEPRDGWKSHLHDEVITTTRILGLLLSVLFAALTYTVTRKTQMLQQTASELQESQALFSGFMDNLPAGAFVRDSAADRILFENHWLRSNLSGTDHGCRFDGGESLPTLRSGPRLMHREMTTSSGQRLHCDTLQFLLVDGSGRELVGAVVMDVSDRVQAEQALDANRARLRALIDTIPDLVWMKDPDGAYLACNRRFEDFFGASEKQIIGRKDHDFVPAELADYFRSHDLAAIAAGGPTMNEERVTFTSDGHEELLETIKTPVHDGNGQLIGVLGIARDITERDAMNRELRDKVNELTRWQSVILGREDRVQELKQEVNALLRKQGLPARYQAPSEGT